MSDNEKKNEIAVFEEIRKDLDITRDISNFKVAMSDVFGKGSLAVKESFGGVTFKDNSVKVDLAIQNTDELQSIWNPDIWSDFSSVLIVHGRQVCHSRKPQCESCSVVHYCKQKFL